MGPCSVTESPFVPLPVSRLTSPVRPNSIASTTPLIPEPFGPEIEILLAKSNVRSPPAGREEDSDQLFGLHFLIRAAQPMDTETGSNGGTGSGQHCLALERNARCGHDLHVPLPHFHRKNK